MTMPESAISPGSKENILSLLRLLDPTVLANPSALYRRMRDHDPVYWDPYMHAWVVTSYQEVMSVVAHCSSDRTPRPEYLDQLGLSIMRPFAEMMLMQMLFMDPPMHSRLRALCSAAFTPRKVEDLRDQIQSVADQLIDKVLHLGRLDMLADLAIPLPAIITSKLMGVPVEDHLQLSAWVSDIAEVHGNFQHRPDRVAQTLVSLNEIKTYVLDRMSELRLRPNEGLICSLMSTEVNGQRLSDEEVVATTIVTIIGGHETTTNLIASGFLTLLNNPVELELLRSKPSIVSSAVEELLRYESPVQHTARIAPVQLELGGKHIAKGAKVVAVLAAANRDPERFPNPDRLDLLREDNRHLAFGWGSHYCFGAPLARLESQIAFNTLLRRLPHPHLGDGTLEWRDNAGLRGLTGLKISFGTARDKVSGVFHD